MSHGNASTAAEAPRGRSFNWWIWLFLAVLALIIGTVGFLRQDGQTSLLNGIYLSLQLFVLHSVHVHDPITWELHLARFMAAGVTFSAVLHGMLHIFRQEFLHFRARYMWTGHTVICGLGRKGMKLLGDCRASPKEGGGRGRVVAITANPEAGVIERCRQLGVALLDGDAADSHLLQLTHLHKARHLMAVCEDDGTNVEIAIRALDLLGDRPGASPPLELWVHVVNMALGNSLRDHPLFAGQDRSATVHIFNMYENSARMLFNDHPLDYEKIGEDDPRQVHLIVAGFGQMGEAVLLQAARIGHFANESDDRRLRVTVIDRMVNERRDKFLCRYPRIDNICDIEFIESEIERPAVLDRIVGHCHDPKTVSTVAACFDDDARNLVIALNLLPRFRDTKTPLLVRVASDSGLAALLEAELHDAGSHAQVHGFGMIDRVCGRDLLMNDRLDKLAQAIHTDFARRRIEDEGRDPATEPSVRPWAELREDFRDSNRQQADHIAVKLRALDWTLAQSEKATEIVTEIEKPHIEFLAKMEHDRWNAERFLAGWTYGKPSQKDKKINEWLVPWDDLPENIRQYDRETVELLPHLLGLVGENIYRKSSEREEL